MITGTVGTAPSSKLGHTLSVILGWRDFVITEKIFNSAAASGHTSNTYAQTWPVGGSNAT